MIKMIESITIFDTGATSYDSEVIRNFEFVYEQNYCSLVH